MNRMKVVPVLIIGPLVVLLITVSLVTPLAELEGRAGEPASFKELAPTSWVIWKLTRKKKSIHQSINLMNSDQTLPPSLPLC